MALVRALEETGRLSSRLAASTTGETKVRFAEKAETQMQHADLIRRLLLTGEMLTEADAAQLEKAENAKR